MKLEKKQRFSIRKYAIGAASVLIGFAFGTQVVSADSVTPTPENPSVAQTAQGESQTAVESRLEERVEVKSTEEKEASTTLASTVEKTESPAVAEKADEAPVNEKTIPASEENSEPVKALLIKELPLVICSY